MNSQLEAKINGKIYSFNVVYVGELLFRVNGSCHFEDNRLREYTFPINSIEWLGVQHHIVKQDSDLTAENRGLLERWV